MISTVPGRIDFEFVNQISIFTIRALLAKLKSIDIERSWRTIMEGTDDWDNSAIFLFTPRCIA